MRAGRAAAGSASSRGRAARAGGRRRARRRSSLDVGTASPPRRRGDRRPTCVLVAQPGGRAGARDRGRGRRSRVGRGAGRLVAEPTPSGAPRAAAHALAVRESRGSPRSSTHGCREPRGTLARAIAELAGAARGASRDAAAARPGLDPPARRVAVARRVALVLAAFGQALGARARHQRAADLAAVAARARCATPTRGCSSRRTCAPGVPNPRHLSTSRRTSRSARARRARGGAANGVPLALGDVTLPRRATLRAHARRVACRATGRRCASGSRDARDRCASRARRGRARRPRRRPGRPRRSGGGYSGPLAYRQGKPMRPDVALAFDRMAARRARRRRPPDRRRAASARRRAGRAVRAAPRPALGGAARASRSTGSAPSSTSARPRAYGWLARNARRFGFVKRYSWEPWHFGYTRNPGTASVGFGVRGGDGRATARAAVVRPAPLRADDRAGRAALAACRRSCSPRRSTPSRTSTRSPRSPAGAQGIAQFMPGTARAYGPAQPVRPGRRRSTPRRT